MQNKLSNLLLAIHQLDKPGLKELFIYLFAYLLACMCV